MPRLSLDEQFARLSEAVDRGDQETLRSELKAALQDRSNLVVERAAKLMAQHELTDLIPDARATFERMLSKPVKSDPGCIAKTAICAALRTLGEADLAFFRQHVSYEQFEPYFGGLEDKAAGLRVECLLALVEHRAEGFLETAVDLLFDSVAAARGGAVRAVAASARPEAPLLLRMKARMGDESSEVMGEVLSGIVTLPSPDVTFLASFLDGPDASVAGEAAFALAESRRPEAPGLILARWRRAPHDPMGTTFLTALALCRHEEALDALCEIAANQELELAKQAMSALQQSPYLARVRQALGAQLTDCLQAERLRYFEELFGEGA
ncbi:MAG: hypothetical protein AAGF97_12845 [Planctomycetota bacterium]